MRKMNFDFWKNLDQKKKTGIIAGVVIVCILIVVILAVCLAGSGGKSKDTETDPSSNEAVSSSEEETSSKERKESSSAADNTEKEQTDASTEEAQQEPQASENSTSGEQEATEADPQQAVSPDPQPEQPAQQTEPQQPAAAPSWKDSFSSSGNTYTCVKTSGTPVQGGGLKIIVNTSEGSVKYIIVDTSGNETVEYITLNYSRGQVERYQYVSAMGQGFYYYCDLNGNNLSVFNTSGEDRTAGAQESGHYDSAVEATREMINSYSAYFSAAFGVSGQQAAMDN